MVICPKCGSHNSEIAKLTAAEVYGANITKWRCLDCGHEGVFPEKIIMAQVWISGHVQGILFRHSTKVKAKQLGLAGWVRNLKDGRVEAVFEGAEDKVKQIINWCKKGPLLASVSNVKVEYGQSTGLNGFEVRRNPYV